jgi:general secretion pathway protein M
MSAALDGLGTRLASWYGSLAPREQLIVRVGAVLGAALLVVGLVARLHGLVGKGEERLAAKRADLAYIQSVLPELRAAPLPQGAGQSLVTIIDRTTRDSGLAATLRGTEPAGAGGMRVRLEGAEFAQVLGWLLRVQREYGLAVQAATLEKTDAPGRVNASVTLVPG